MFRTGPYFFLTETDAVWSETKKYAKIFFYIFARGSVKNLDIFIKYWNFSKHFSIRAKVFFHKKNIRFRPFCIFWYAYRKIIIKTIFIIKTIYTCNWIGKGCQGVLGSIFVFVIFVCNTITFKGKTLFACSNVHINFGIFLVSGFCVIGILVL